MSYIDLKISDQEAGANNVQSAPNVLIKTPQENKAVFDALPDIVRQRFNSLIDELTQGGYLPLQGQEDLIIRINSTNGKMEFSLDAGQTWQASANEGHRILTSDGTVMPQRSDLRFEGANVRTEENQTIVNFQSGAQGIPTGGTAGQVLKKVSDESYDAYWADKAEDSEKLGGVLASDFMRTSQNQSLIAHPQNNLNPHNVTKSQVGLGNVENVPALPLSGGTVTGLTIFHEGVQGRSWLLANQNGYYFYIGRGAGFRGLTSGGASTFFTLPDSLRIMDINAVGYVPAYASAFTPASSIRFKENVQNLTEEDALKILDLTPVSYTLKNKLDADGNEQKANEITDEDGKVYKFTSAREFGLIAEDVAEIIPEIVHYNEKGEAEALNYMELIAHLIFVAKHQQTQIDELKNRLEAQHDTI